MSDITKKIFSIEPVDEPVGTSSEKILRPVSDPPETIAKTAKTEAVPDFVTRDVVQPLTSPPAPLEEDVSDLRGGGWLIFGFGVIYVIAVGLQFGLPLAIEPLRLVMFDLAGLVILLTLPLILLFLLWRTLKHLSRVNEQNVRMAKAANVLVSPDQTALSKTESLAGGIQVQISHVNKSLSETVEALKGVQIAVTRESQALDAAGLALANRSDDVGRNLTLQRQALDSMTDTFDTRITTLSGQISNSSQALDEVCTSAETKIQSANAALNTAAEKVENTVQSGSERIDKSISSLGEMSRKLDETAEALTEDLASSTQTLKSTDVAFTENSDEIQRLNTQTENQIAALRATIAQGQDMLAELRGVSEARTHEFDSYFADLSTRLKRSEDETLAVQGQTTRMVETNLAQMRRDFSRMETDLQSLRSKISNLRQSSDDLPEPELKPSRLNLKPLDSDFPPVEPPRFPSKPKETNLRDTPLNLGMDMEIETEDDPLINFEPEVIRRPGESKAESKSKGFGRRASGEEKSGWRWRDMLGGLEKPDSLASELTPSPLSSSAEVSVSRQIDGVALLSAIQLTPGAIVDEGTVIEATQARINSGEPGLTTVVADKLSEAVLHLQEQMATNPNLKSDLRKFAADFSKMIGNTPPTAPALRAAFGSPEGRAYLLCAAAFRPELRA